ncbi:MAG: deoxyhypusine synthase [Candidatus Bathyarchaeia archaeon]
MVAKAVKQIPLSPDITLSQLVSAMRECGVLGAGRLGRALELTVEMLTDEDYTVFLTLGGPLVPGGLRRVIQTLIARDFIDYLITTGANLVHDIVEALGYPGRQGSFHTDDTKLRALGIGRAGDIFFLQKGFEALEKKIYQVLDSLKIPQEGLSVSEFLTAVGESIDDENSILKTLALKRMPVFCPAILDSMLGLHLWTYGQLHPLRINPLKDMSRLADIVCSSKKVGALILGGGTSKHFLLGACMLRDGLDAAVQITLDRPEGGSIGGAPLEEAVSWRKARNKRRLVTIIGDVTIVFPILMAAVLQMLEKR